jgi:hypothetical protein
MEKAALISGGLSEEKSRLLGRFKRADIDGPAVLVIV